MNTPSPAPQRRRRHQAQQTCPLDLSNPEIADESTQDSNRPSNGQAARFSANPGQSPAHRQQAADQSARKRVRAAANTPGKYTSSGDSSFLDQFPLALRIALMGLCLAVFFTCAVSITRNYLSEQEERRRLEAEAAERAQHPLYYADLITQYAAAQDLDPALVCAIILCESSFNPEAVSYLGARGLMQTMPDTAEWIAHKLDEDASYSFDNLFDPKTNIRYGTWYLGYLTRRFDGDATKVVCAYHAGQGNVDAWLKNPAYSRDSVTLDVIPTDDTATYASRVLRARDVYRKYYFPAATAQPPVS